MAKKTTDISNRGNLNSVGILTPEEIIDRVYEEPTLLGVAEMHGYPLISNLSDATLGKETPRIIKEGKFIYTYQVSEMGDIGDFFEYNTLVGARVRTLNERIINFHMAIEEAIEPIGWDDVRDSAESIAKMKAQYDKKLPRKIALLREKKYLDQALNCATRFANSDDIQAIYDGLGNGEGAPTDIANMTPAEFDVFAQAMAMHFQNIGYTGTPVWLINARTKRLLDQLLADKVVAVNNEGEEMRFANVNVYGLYGMVFIYSHAFQNVDKLLKQSNTIMMIVAPGTARENLDFIVPLAEHDLTMVNPFQTANEIHLQYGSTTAYGCTISMPMAIVDNYSDMLSNLYYIVTPETMPDGITPNPWQQDPTKVVVGEVLGDAPTMNPIVNRTVRSMVDAIYDNGRVNGDGQVPPTNAGKPAGTQAASVEKAAVKPAVKKPVEGK